MKTFMYTRLKKVGTTFSPISGVYGFTEANAEKTINGSDKFKLFKEDLIEGNDRFAIISYKDEDIIDVFANADIGLGNFIKAEYALFDLALREKMFNRNLILTVI